MAGIGRMKMKELTKVEREPYRKAIEDAVMNLCAACSNALAQGLDVDINIQHLTDFDPLKGPIRSITSNRIITANHKMPIEEIVSPYSPPSVKIDIEGCNRDDIDLREAAK